MANRKLVPPPDLAGLVRGDILQVIPEAPIYGGALCVFVRYGPQGPIVLLPDSGEECLFAYHEVAKVGRAAWFGHGDQWEATAMPVRLEGDVGTVSVHVDRDGQRTLGLRVWCEGAPEGLGSQHLVGCRATLEVATAGYEVALREVEAK